MTFGSFLSPKIIFSPNSIDMLEKLLNEMGASNYLLVSDEVLKSLGTLGKAKERLKKFQGMTYITKTREPYIEDAENIAQEVRGKDFDVVIGVGGGSVLDLAKTAAMACKNPKPIPEYLGRNKVENKGIPTILIPTTSGTGSEVSQAVVLSRPDGVKVAIWDPKILPNVALLDPVLTVTMPPRVTASTGFDALTHAFEALTSKLANPITDALAFNAIRLIFQNLPRAYINGDDLLARYNMLLASTMAGLAFSNSSLTVGHAIPYTYSHNYKLPHGVACALALPYTLMYNGPAVHDKIRMVANIIGIHEINPLEAIKKVAKKVIELMEIVGLPLTLHEIGVKKEELRSFAKDLMEKYSRLLPNNPREIDEDRAFKLLENMWEGRLSFS